MDYFTEAVERIDALVKELQEHASRLKDGAKAILVLKKAIEVLQSEYHISDEARDLIIDAVIYAEER